MLTKPPVMHNFPMGAASYGSHEYGGYDDDAYDTDLLIA